MTPFGVYVHIPFCARRCDYCAFATWTDRDHLQSSYVDASAREIEKAALPIASSVFFGGGTPSLLPAASLLRLLSLIPRASDAEVTVECNPETVTLALLDAYARGGVTRVSFGVQSMRAHVLRSLGREHDPSTVVRAVGLAKDVGFASWSVDLIYGGVGESLDDWRRTIDDVLAFDPPHVSAYALTVEAGTPLARDTARHPDDDDQAAKYALADELFAAAGLGWYEVSNWARAGHECRHNLLYWTGGPYRGIGCAAHSYDGDRRRWWNVRTPERYIDAIDRGVSPIAADDVLTASQRAHEALSLSLRTRVGVPAEALSDRQAIDALVTDSDDGRAVLTREGRMLANEVALRLVG
jgi:putative oxygen-independent coproporphyrinogen III oxidase